MAPPEGLEPPFSDPITIREVEALLGYGGIKFIWSHLEESNPYLNVRSVRSYSLNEGGTICMVSLSGLEPEIKVS